MADDVNIEVSPELLPLQQQGAPQGFGPVVIPVPGQLHSLDGMLGPDIAVVTAASLNGVAVSATPAANTLTLGVTGVGSMAQRNAIGAVADLNQTISSPPTQAEVQAITDKIDELLAAMRTAAHLTP